MIELTRKDTGRPIHVNPAFIVTIEDTDANGTLLHIQAGGSCITHRVLQTAIEIIRAMPYPTNKTTWKTNQDE